MNKSSSMVTVSRPFCLPREDQKNGGPSRQEAPEHLGSISLTHQKTIELYLTSHEFSLFSSGRKSRRAAELPPSDARRFVQPELAQGSFVRVSRPRRLISGSSF